MMVLPEKAARMWMGMIKARQMISSLTGPYTIQHVAIQEGKGEDDVLQYSSCSRSSY